MRHRGELALLIGIVAVGGWLRLRSLGLAEFKADEARALELAGDVLDGRFPATGLVSSVGALNPPLFPYLLALPASVDPGPLFVTGAIGVAALLAIALTYAVLRPRFGALAALTAVALYATAPWAVLFGRKIWAQNLLPLAAVGLLWSLFVVLERRRTRWVAAVPVLLCLALQLHFSALALLGPAAVVLAYRARNVDWTALAAGAALALVLLAPYAAYEVGHGLEDVRLLVTEGRGSGEGDTPGAGSVEAVRQTVRLVGAVGWDYVTGASSAAVRDAAGRTWAASRLASAAVGLALVTSVVWFAAAAWRGARRSRGFPGVAFATPAAHRALFGVWLVCAWAAFAASTPNDVFPHYLIVTYPVAFAAVGVVLSDLASAAGARVGCRRAAAVAVTGATLVATSFVAFTLEFQSFVAREGGTAGDYGVAYRHSSALASFAAERGLAFAATDPALSFLATGSTRPVAGGGNGAVVTVTNTLRDESLPPCAGVVRRFGPLAACVPSDATG